MSPRWALPAAALASLCMHAALLSLPLGARPGEFLLSGGPFALRAVLRPLPPEPLSESAPPSRLPDEPLRQAAASPRRDARGGPSDVAGIPPAHGIYFPASQLTVQPQALAPLPLELLRRVVVRPGTAELTLLIDETGSVTGIEVDASTLPPAAVARAQELLRAARFSPGRMGEVVVKSRLGVTIRIEDRFAGE